jgi:hypothetical protein
MQATTVGAAVLRSIPHPYLDTLRAWGVASVGRQHCRPVSLHASTRLPRPSCWTDAEYCRPVCASVFHSLQLALPRQARLATCCKLFLAALRVAAWWRFMKLTNGVSPVRWRSIERLCDPAAADSRRAGRCRLEVRYRRSLRVRGGIYWLRGGVGIHTATLTVCA